MAALKTTLKDWPKIYDKIRHRRRMDQHQKILFARFAAATPDERWQMNENCIKALRLSEAVRSRRSLERRKAKLRRMGNTVLLKFGFSNEEIASGQMFGLGMMEVLL